MRRRACSCSSCLHPHPHPPPPILSPPLAQRLPQTHTILCTCAQVVRLSLVGEGTQGAMAIEPSCLDLAAVRVGHPVRKTVTLANQSDGVLRYLLECGVDEARDGRPDPADAPVDLTGAERVLVDRCWVDTSCKVSLDCSLCGACLWHACTKQHGLHLLRYPLSEPADIPWCVAVAQARPRARPALSCGWRRGPRVPSQRRPPSR